MKLSGVLPGWRVRPVDDASEQRVINEPEKPSALRAWVDLDPWDRTELLEAFGHYQDSLPPTCSMEIKNERFTAWLREHGVLWPGPD